MNAITTPGNSSNTVKKTSLAPIQALPSEEYTVKTMPNVLGSLNMTAIY